jgi:hypothetical protein
MGYGDVPGSWGSIYFVLGFWDSGFLAPGFWGSGSFGSRVLGFLDFCSPGLWVWHGRWWDLTAWDSCVWTAGTLHSSHWMCKGFWWCAC